MKTKLILLVLIVPFLFVINSCSEDPIIEETFSVEGIVTYLGTPVSDVQIKHDNDSTLTDSAGFYKFSSIKRGNNTFTISHPEFIIDQITINITGNTDLPIELNIDSSLLSIEGIIIFENTPVPGATIEFANNTLLIDSSGYFIIQSPGVGNHSLKIIHPRFRTIDTLINLTRKVSLTFSVSLRDNSFFPLAVGNKWYYERESSHFFVTEVISKEMIGEVEYFRLKDTPGTESLYRFSSDTLIKRMCDEDVIFAIFEIDSGATFIYRYCEDGWRRNYDGTMSEKSINERRIYYDDPNAWDEEHYIKFVRGVGWTIRSNPWVWTKLISYEIKY